MAYSLILAEVEVAYDGRHSQFVGSVQDEFQPAHRVGPKHAVLIEGAILPWLLLRIPLGASTLQADGEAEQSATPPVAHRGDELPRIAFRIPLVGVGILPAGARLQVQIVEDALHHSGVH